MRASIHTYIQQPSLLVSTYIRILVPAILDVDMSLQNEPQDSGEVAVEGPHSRPVVLL